jgi:hypothetical protein
MNRASFVASGAVLPFAGVLPLRAAASPESEIALVTASGTLAGTLLLPSGVAKPPVVLIIAGSGPTDRNGNSPALTLNIYRKLAAALAEQGVASVRYDKRGVAESAAAATSEATLCFETYIGDAVGWLGKLRSDPRFGRLVIAGHSEGSLIGMNAARQFPVDGFVSLEGAGFPAPDVLRKQLAPQLAPYPDLAKTAEHFLSELSAGRTVPVPADLPPGLLALFRASVQPYLISWFAHDPRTDIAAVPGSVVIVQGSHDIQVPVEDGKALAAAKPSATFVLVDQMTHVLTDDPATDLAGQLPGAYADAARPLNATLVRTLVAAATGGASATPK